MVWGDHPVCTGYSAGQYGYVRATLPDGLVVMLLLGAKARGRGCEEKLGEFDSYGAHGLSLDPHWTHRDDRLAPAADFHH